MTDQQEALVSAIFGFLFAAVFVLGLVIVKTREEQVRIKERLDALIERVTRRRVRRRDEEDV